MLKMSLPTILSLFFTICLASEVSGKDVNPSLQKFSFRQKKMGVDFTITVYAPSEAIANRAASAAYARIEKLNKILSDYNPESEISRLGRLSGPGKPVRVSPDLLKVMTHSLALSRKSNGAFDVTLGHLTRLWRLARRTKMLPSDQERKSALSRTGYQYVRINSCQSTVELLKTGMRLDMGGIAKGYAADEALKVLKKHGLTRAMVDASGDISIGDPPPGKAGWVIGIASLRKPNAPPNRYLELKNVAVATSGDAFQYVQIDGKRFSHIINPKTGLGLTTRSSVTVIAPTGIQADSLASAVSVLGMKRGIHLIEQTAGAEALFVQLKEGGLLQRTSSGFRQFLYMPRKRAASSQ
ncbi:MAG: FAD:protein FMN transferase [Planctomycetaceae bacterium]